MCWYAMYPYKPHYACFSCQKTFKRRLLGDVQRDSKTSKEAKCPQCSDLMANMGLAFESPKKDNVKAWNHIKALYTVGITFHSCGCTGPGYIPKDNEMLLLYLKEILVEYNQQLSFWRNRTEPLTKSELDREYSKHGYYIGQIPAELRPKTGAISNEDAKNYWLNRIQEVTQKIVQISKS